MSVLPSTRLFIGGLKRSVGKEELTTEFGQYGNIIDVWIAFDPAGFAFVEYSSVEEAEKALEAKHKTICFGSEIRVEYTQRRQNKDNDKQADESKPRLYVGKIKTAVEKENVRAVFEKFGMVTDVWIAHNPPGFAFVEYDTMEEAQKAVDSCDGKEHFGGAIKVQITNAKTDGRKKRFKDRRAELHHGRPFGKRYPFHGYARRTPYSRGIKAARENYNSYYDETYYPPAPSVPPPSQRRGVRSRAHFRRGCGGRKGGSAPQVYPPPSTYHRYGAASYYWDPSNQEDMGYTDYQEQGYHESYSMPVYETAYYTHDHYTDAYY